MKASKITIDELGTPGMPTSNVLPAFAARVGASLAGIHSATAGRADVAARFATDAIFYAIRLEPYLVATGKADGPVQ